MTRSRIERPESEAHLSCSDAVPAWPNFVYPVKGLDTVNDRVAPMFGFITNFISYVVIIILLASKNRPTKRNLNVLILGPKESNAL